MNRGEVDGVPVFWVDGPPPLSAVLMFRVGMRDEPFVRRGITHLVEHLAMSRIGRRHHEYNAGVDVGLTTFEASGPAQAVAAFLTDVCTALHDLPIDRLVTERKVLAVEAQDGGGIVELHLLLRYGLRGPGLAAAEPPAPEALDAAAVRDWAGRRFLRSAAALALTGPPPPQLRLPLPDGLVPARARVEPLPMAGPLWTEHPTDRGMALSMLVPAGEAALAAARIARQRLTDELRHRLGLAYDIDIDLGASEPASDEPAASTGVLTLIADPPASSAGQAAAVLEGVLRDLARSGPTAVELADDLAEGRAVSEDPRSALDMAAYAATEHLFLGRDWNLDRARAEREAVGSVEVAAALDRYPDTAILSVPEGARPRLAGFSPYPEHLGTPVSGRVFKRQLFGPVPRRASLVVGEEGVSLVMPAGAATVRWDDVVGYGQGPDELRTLYGGDACTIDLHPLFFRDGAEALRLIEARVPDSVRFDQRPPPDDPSDRRRNRRRP